MKLDFFWINDDYNNIILKNIYGDILYKISDRLEKEENIGFFILNNEYEFFYISKNLSVKKLLSDMIIIIVII